jgi:tetratricopeptide (TPR) repeat protein
MQIPALQLAARPKSLVISVLLGVGCSIAFYTIFSAPRDNPAGKYPFQRPVVGSVTQNIQREITFHQRLIQQQPASGLERAALAQAYLRMARATGESSWYLLAEQTARASLAQLAVDNNGATIVLAKVAAAKHDFAQSLSLLKQLPPQVESLALLTTNYLAIGQVNAARQTVDRLTTQMPTLGNLTLKALVEVAQGQDQNALRDFQAAIAAEEPEEAGSSAGVRTLLGRFYYKRGQLQQAEELYRSALQILPKYPPALLNLAELSVRRWQANPQQTKDQEQATQLYNQFFLTNQQAPTVYDHVALRGSARLQLLQGQTKLAQKTWARAVSRLRSDLSGFGHRRELAQLLLERGQQQDYAEALSLMQAEIKIRQDPETWDTLAAAYLQLGQLPAAEQAIQKALKSGIRDPGLFDRAATITSSQGQTAQAQYYQQQRQSIDPLFDQGARQAIGLGVGLLGLN